MNPIAKKLKYLFITAIILIILPSICYAGNNSDEYATGPISGDYDYDEYPTASLGGNIHLNNRGEMSELMTDFMKMTGYTVNLSYGNNRRNDEKTIYESVNNLYINHMDKRIVIKYTIGDNSFIFIIDENDEILQKIDREKIKETFTSQYETVEERLYTGLSTLVREIYKYGDFETTDLIENILNADTSNDSNDNNIIVYIMILLTAILFVILVVSRKLSHRHRGAI